MDLLYDHEPGIRISVECVGNSKPLREIVPLSMMGMVHFLGSKTNQDLADAFVRDIRDGTNLPEFSPVLALRRASMNMQHGGGSEMVSSTYLAVVIKAWLAYEVGKAVRVLRWNQAEGFPSFRTAWPHDAHPNVLRALGITQTGATEANTAS